MNSKRLLGNYLQTGSLAHYFEFIELLPQTIQSPHLDVISGSDILRRQSIIKFVDVSCVFQRTLVLIQKLPYRLFRPLLLYLTISKRVKNKTGHPRLHKKEPGALNDDDTNKLHYKTMKLLWTLSALTGLASAVKRNTNGGFRTNKKDLHNTGRDWVTLDNGVQFQPGRDMDPRIEHVRKLWSGNQDVDPYHEVFIDGGETYYDEYSQAWRALGFYIDCDANEADYYDERRRSLQGEDEQGGCLRYMLWAAVS
jgi:hypothetical protein